MEQIQSRDTLESAEKDLTSYEREPVSVWAFFGVGLAIGLLFISMI
ncbi:hypothetical protein [Microvirga pudoricolor]|nr:hypothetical protein [Microvirga pudoricolor]MBM6594346.1 hypothetical protein [Microvirga pudoricolor]